MNEDKINFRRIFTLALKYWYLFALFLPLAVGGAYFYLKSTPKLYQADAMLLIKDEERGGQLLEESIFNDLGINKKSKKLENEIHVLGAVPLMEKVVRRLNIQYNFAEEGRFMNRDLYKESPLKVVDWKPEWPDSALMATISVDKVGGYRIKLDEKAYKDYKLEETEFLGEFGKDLHLPMGYLNLTRDTRFSFNKPIVITILPPADMAKGLAKELSVSAMGQESSTLQVGIQDHVAKRAEEVLSTLFEEYNIQSIQDKNRVYENSLDLINDRIDLVSRELAEAEFSVAAFKRQNNTLELSQEGNLLMQELTNFGKEINEKDIQLQILNTIENYLSRNRDTFEFVPTYPNLSDQTLPGQLQAFNDLLRQRVSVRAVKGPKHSEVQMIDKQIQNLRQTIVASIRTIKDNLELSRNANVAFKNDLESRIQSLPGQERQLVERERDKNIKESLYLYLLQKREEAIISLAITDSAGKVIEPPKAGHPISPKPAQAALVAFFLGLGLPAGLIFLLSSMNDKVQTENDIEKATKVQVAGILAHSKKNGHFAIKENSATAAAEMFRLLRANLSFIAPGRTFKVLMVTSSISGEGKSYIARNLAMTQALAGKRALLMELDLRKPSKLANGEEQQTGVVDYLANPKIGVEKIIRHGETHENLDIISCGPKPTNPSELILSERLRRLIEEMRERYDFIVIDTPPVGLVADALHLRDVADVTMYVVRSAYTPKNQLQIIEDIAKKNKLPQPFIVLNDVKLSKENGYYGKGYYIEN